MQMRHVDQGEQKRLEVNDFEKNHTDEVELKFCFSARTSREGLGHKVQ